MKKSLMILAVFFCCAGIAMAGDYLQDKDQDRKRDGSCLEDAVEAAPGLELAADRLKDRDKDKDHKRDGSCLL